VPLTKSGVSPDRQSVGAMFSTIGICFWGLPAAEHASQYGSMCTAVWRSISLAGFVYFPGLPHWAPNGLLLVVRSRIGPRPT